jgi:hypothetical protein
MRKYIIGLMAIKSLKIKIFYLMFLLFLSIVLLTTRIEGFEIKTGTAKGIITPDKSMFMTIWRVAEGKNHDLFARVLVLNDGIKRLVIVTYDLSSFAVATPILRERCKNELGIDVPYLILIATHNHQAPLPRLPENHSYQKWVADRVFDLIKEAIDNEKGFVKIYFGNGYGYFIRERVSDSDTTHISSNAPTDYEIQLLKVMCGNQVIAMLFNHPTHPLEDEVTKYGVGHPGYALDEIEKKIPGVLAMYGAGCGGNQGVIPPEGIKDRLEAVKLRGRELAQIVLKISSEPMKEITGPISSKFEVISLPLAPPISYEETLQLARGIPLNIGIDYLKDRRTNWIRVLIKHYKEGIPFPKTTSDYICTDDANLVFELDKPRAFPCRFEEVIVAKIGSMPLVAMQGEVCAPIGMRIKDEFRYKMPVMAFAYMGEQELYIPTRELVRMDAYQARIIRQLYNSPCGWAPEVEDEMVSSVTRIINSLLKEK